MIRPRLASHELLLEELRESLFVKNTEPPHRFVVHAWRLVNVIAGARHQLGSAISATQLLDDLSNPEELFQRYSEFILDRDGTPTWKDDIALTQIFCPDAVVIPLHTNYSPYIQALLTYITAHTYQDETLEHLVSIMGYEQHFLERLTASVRWALWCGETPDIERQLHAPSHSYAD
jgi:hypothetical protein